MARPNIFSTAYALRLNRLRIAILRKLRIITEYNEKRAYRSGERTRERPIPEGSALWSGKTGMGAGRGRENGWQGQKKAVSRSK